MYKRTIILFVLLLSAILSMNACLPTPEQEIVINKGDGKAQQAILESPDLQTTSAPEEKKSLQCETVSAHWTYDASTDMAIMPIDAEVHCSKGPYPVDRVEKRTVSPDDINRLVRTEACIEGSGRIIFV